jgi:hypothetical protein
MKRLELSRLKSLQPPVSVVRYERAAAGDLLHIDTKKLGRIDGIGHRITGDRTSTRCWEMVHLAIDDHSRVSFAQVLSDEKAVSCVQFLRGGRGLLRRLGRAHPARHDPQRQGLQERLQGRFDELGIRHIKTRPYTPKTNGKAERFGA